MGISSTDEMGLWLARFQAGEPGARGRLVDRAFRRLDRLARQMLGNLLDITRWEEAGEVRRAALIRLVRAVEPCPAGAVRDFLRLAARQIRRELIDLVRDDRGLAAADRRQAGAAGTAAAGAVPPARSPNPAGTTHQSERLAAWIAFHERVEGLPDDECEIFDLFWYQGLTRPEVAALVGEDEHTVHRRWQAARLRLYREMDGRLPGL